MSVGLTAIIQHAILSPTMKISSYASLSLLLLITLSMIPSALAFEGPLQTKNHFPLFGDLNMPYLESAATENSFSTGLSHSSLFMLDRAENWTVNIDVEVTELELRYRREIGGLFELGIDLPVLSFNSGFLDSILNSYHRTFGFGDYGRNARPDNVFLYEVTRNGTPVIKSKGGCIGIGDTRLTFKKKLLADDPLISVRAEIELPTGSVSKGFGSGGFDSGISVLINKRLKERFLSYVNLGVVLPGDLRAGQKIELRNYLHGGAGVEAALGEKFSLLGQIYFQTSPFPKTFIGAIDRISSLLSFGGRYSSGVNSLEFSISEDTNTAGAPDVTFNLFFRKKL